MAFDVSALTNYTEENAEFLLRLSQFGNKTGALVQAQGNVQPGIKTAEKLGIVAGNAEFQSDSSCGFNTSGTTTFTQRTITVGDIKVQEEWCPKDLETKYLQKAMKPGSSQEEFPFEEMVFDQKIEILNEQLETADWQGDTASGVNNLKFYDGLVKIIDAEGSVVSATASTINAANIRTILQDIITKIPAAIIDKQDLMVFTGFDVLRTYTNKLATDNLFHITGETNRFEDINIENTNIKLVAVHGLDSQNRIFAMRTDNMWLGVDMMNEEDSFPTWFSMDDRVIKFHTAFKRGWQIAHPAEIVEYTNT